MMLSKKTLATLVVVVAVLVVIPALAQEGHKYIGVKKCSMCHKTKNTGDQFTQWQGTKHAKAMETLKSDKAKEVATKAGVTGDPSASDKCLKCHTTAFGVDKAMLDAAFSPDDGVQCEACHGPGSDYGKMDIMKDKEKSKAAGMILPDEGVCKKCHNPDSPTFDAAKGFNFTEMVKQIAHPIPPKA